MGGRARYSAVPETGSAMNGSWNASAKVATHLRVQLWRAVAVCVQPMTVIRLLYRKRHKAQACLVKKHRIAVCRVLPSANPSCWLCTHTKIRVGPSHGKQDCRRVR